MAGSPRSENDSTAVLLHEMAEALTALGNYLAVAHRSLEHQPDPRSPLGEVLTKSQCQCERASRALRRLSGNFRQKDAPGND